MLTLDESSFKPSLVSPLEMPVGSFGVIRNWKNARYIGAIVHRINTSFGDVDQKVLLILGHESDKGVCSDYWELSERSSAKDIKGIEILPAGTTFKVA